MVEMNSEKVETTMSNANVINMSNANLLPATATREQISRWMDGDIAAHEVEHALSVLGDADNRYCWAEMHFVGDCIRGLEPTASGCADRIRAAIAEEPAIVAPRVKVARERAVLQEKNLFASMRQMGRGGRAWATAAAIAAVGFVGTVMYQDQGRTNMAAVVPASGVVQQAVQPEQMPRAATLASTKPAEFNLFLQAHQESADATSVSTVRQYLRPAVSMQPQ
jgi:negative regulator of sigma E activity